MSTSPEKPFRRKLAEQVISTVVVAVVGLGMFGAFWQWSFGGLGNTFIKFGPDSGLKIIDHRDHRTNGRLDVVGSFENTGKTTWSSVTIEVELFDAQGVFVDECKDYDSGSFPPGSKEYFKVSCGGCKEHPLPDFSSYTVKIKDASTL